MQKAHLYSWCDFCRCEAGNKVYFYNFIHQITHQKSSNLNKELKTNLRVPSNRVAIVSRNVFCGANNPFITGIFPAKCRSPHQSYWREGSSRANVWGAPGWGAGPSWTSIYLVNSAQCDPSTARRARGARARVARSSSCVFKWQEKMKPTGAVQVVARDDGGTVMLPVSGVIIMPLVSMIIFPQRAMVGDINHSQLQLWSKRKGRCGDAVAAQEINTFIFWLLFT